MSTRPKGKILIVDDEIDFVSLFIQVADLSGYSCFGAYSVSHALQVFHQVDPFLVVTDFKMPNGTGLDLIEVIKDQSPETVCFLISGFVEFEGNQKIHRVDRIIEKPFDYRRIMDCIDLYYEKFQNKGTN